MFGASATDTKLKTVMKITVTEDRFIKAFHDKGRAGYKDGWTDKALVVLFDWLTSIENLNDNDNELDVIGLCSSYAEYRLLDFLRERDKGGSWEDWTKDYETDDFLYLSDEQEKELVAHVKNCCAREYITIVGFTSEPAPRSVILCTDTF